MKIVCGTRVVRWWPAGPTSRAVNVHNPEDAAIRFTVKVALALPDSTRAGVPRAHRLARADEALEVDCPDIRTLAPTKDKFLKGFLVLESVRDFDVVAVYTVAGADGEIRALEIERVPARPRTTTSGVSQ